jgi:hypothetical protein
MSSDSSWLMSRAGRGTDGQVLDVSLGGDVHPSLI